jgi:hypothetical protein
VRISPYLIEKAGVANFADQRRTTSCVPVG